MRRRFVAIGFVATVCLAFVSADSRHQPADPVLFAAPVTIPFGANRVAFADFNNDGRTDIAAAGLAGAAVLLKDGSAAFGEPVVLHSEGSLSIVTADFNNDLNPDVAVDLGTGIQTYLGNGTGGFSLGPQFPFSGPVPGLASGDFDHDGSQDLAVPYVFNGSVAGFKVLRGSGTGAFIEVGTYPGWEYSNGRISAGDYNGDGDLDINLTVMSFDNVPNFASQIFFGDGAGGFPGATVVPSGRQVSAGDLDGDGDLDLIGPWYDREIVINLNDGFGSFSGGWPPEPWPGELWFVTSHSEFLYAVGAQFPYFSNYASAVGDFNLDAKLDAVIIDLSPKRMSVWIGSGTGTFNAITEIPIGGSDVAVADLNQDGKPDIVVPQGDQISILYNTFVPEVGSTLTSAGAAAWIGLKNSDDVGTKFDLLAEVLKNGNLIGTGQLNAFPGGGSGFNNAAERAITAALAGPTAFGPGDTLSIRLSARIAVDVSGHASGTARLWYNDGAANSRIDALINGVARTFYLTSGSVLSAAPGVGPKGFMDVLVKRAGGNPFKPFGSWSITF